MGTVGHPGEVGILSQNLSGTNAHAIFLEIPVQGTGREVRSVQGPHAIGQALQGLFGMTPRQIRRHAHGVLHAVQEGLHARPQRPPQTNRESDVVRDRYNRLHTWRKNRARARGVESDVILPRTALWDLARRRPLTHGELAHITDFDPWRRETYGEEILALLTRATKKITPL